MSVKEVIDRHMQAFFAGDVAATVADYADDAVMVSPRGAARGHDEIRATFERIFGGMFAPGTYEWTTDVEHIEGDVAYLVWHAACDGADVLLGTDTLIVRDGKIRTQTVAMHVQPR